VKSAYAWIKADFVGVLKVTVENVSAWIGIASASAAWLALLLSVFNFRTSRKALQLSEKQEERRKPLLVPYLQQGYIWPGPRPNIRVYAFLLSISNRSDNNNAVAGAIIQREAALS
jgi:hypothetical protein